MKINKIVICSIFCFSVTLVKAQEMPLLECTTEGTSGNWLFGGMFKQGKTFNVPKLEDSPVLKEKISVSPVEIVVQNLSAIDDKITIDRQTGKFKYSGPRTSYGFVASGTCEVRKIERKF